MSRDFAVGCAEVLDRVGYLSLARGAGPNVGGWLAVARDAIWTDFATLFEDEGGIRWAKLLSLLFDGCPCYSVG